MPRGTHGRDALSARYRLSQCRGRGPGGSPQPETGHPVGRAPERPFHPRATGRYAGRDGYSRGRPIDLVSLGGPRMSAIPFVPPEATPAPDAPPHPENIRDLGLSVDFIRDL